jgi:membrane anchored protein
LRIRRVIGVLIAVALAVLGAPATASAEPYPAQPPPSSVSHGTVPNGGKVTFSGRGFLPFERISIVVNFAPSNSTAAFRPSSADGFVPAGARLARRSTLIVIADKTGAFSVEVQLSQIGSATLVATGLTSGHTVTAHVEVLGPAAPHHGGGGRPADDHPALPTTGQSGRLLLTIVSSGAAAVLLGGVLLSFARRRRRID